LNSITQRERTVTRGLHRGVGLQGAGCVRGTRRSARADGRARTQGLDRDPLRAVGSRASDGWSAGPGAASVQCLGGSVREARGRREKSRQRRLGCCVRITVRRKEDEEVGMGPTSHRVEGKERNLTCGAQVP
jgi:hypothetical protein